MTTEQTNNSNLAEEKGLSLQLSEAGKYSYAALCALSLHELFGSQWDMPYSKQCNTLFIQHVGLPSQVKETMDCLLAGQAGQSYQAYVEMLLAEPSVSTNSVVIIQDLVLFAIKSGRYDARSRVLVMHIASLLGAPKPLVQLTEENLGHSLLAAAKSKQEELTPAQQTQSAKRERRRKFRRYALIGLATVGGGALLGLTGGLAAPLIGVGVGAIVGGGAAAAIGSVAGAAIVGSLFGLAGAGLTGYRMKRRVGEIEEFEFGRLNPSEEEGEVSPEETAVEGELHIVIAISGWLNSGDSNFCLPWKSLRSSREQYFLRYESTYLRELGHAMDMLYKAAMTSAIQEVLKFTVFRGLLAAVAWPASLLSLSNVIDNPWGTCLRRSAQVGRHLAEVLLSKQHGGRPVTLVGFSLGARVIFYCLRELADRRPGSEGLVQDAIMLGAPVTGSIADWEDICTVVAGKLINGYCRSDWLLKFLYRTTSANVNVAGLSNIECDNRRLVNVDLTDVVSGHLDYASNIATLLKVVGVKTSEGEEESNLRKSVSAAVISSEKTPVMRHSTSLPVIFDATETSENFSEKTDSAEEVSVV